MDDSYLFQKNKVKCKDCLYKNPYILLSKKDFSYINDPYILLSEINYF